MPFRFSCRPTSLLMGCAFAAAALSCGRKSRYCELAIGMTVCSPSLPPPSWIITRTLSFCTAADFAESTARANTSGTAAYPDESACAPTPNTSPLRRKSRRDNPFVPPSSFIAAPSSLQLEFRRREQDEPARRVVRARVEELGRRRAHDAVEVHRVRVLERGDLGHAGERCLREVHAREDVVARDPARVRRPAADLGRVEQKLAHALTGDADRLRERRSLERLRHVHHELRRRLQERAVVRRGEELRAH